jgi:hypothetical protein
MAGSTELPGLIGIVDRLLLETVACDEKEKCREYVHTCIVGSLLSDTLMRLAKSKSKVPVEKLYETVMSQFAHDIILRRFAPLIADVLDRMVKYLETHCGVKNGVATRDSLLKAVAHIEAAMVFLGCWPTFST